jgi:folate/biopterin transporter
MWYNSVFPEGFPPEFNWIIARIYLFVKGMAGSIIVYGTLPLFRSTFKLTGIQYQTYSTIALLPWTMKPIIGAIVDTFPLWGYRKRFYVLGALILGCLSFAVLGLESTVYVTTTFLFLASFAIMVIDLVYEGEYSSLMAFHHGSTQMPAFVWSCVMLGSVFGASLVGPLGDQGDIRYVYPIATLCLLQMVASLVRQPLLSFSRDRVPKVKTDSLTDTILASIDDVRRPVKPAPLTTQDWILCSVMVGVSLLFLGLLFTSATHPWITVGIAVFCMLLLHSLAFVTFVRSTHPIEAARQRQLWTYNLFMFLVEALYINISGVQDFWYTADARCVPNGPAFSLTLYTTTVAVISALAGIVASLLYTHTLRYWTFRSVLQFAIVFQVTTAFTDIVIAKRWNQTHLGISDEWFFLLGDAVVSPIASMLKLIPMGILTSKIVEHGKETMTYSLLAGFQNMGLVFSKILGLALIASFDIQTTLPTCSFTFYPALIFLAHMISPMLAFCLAYVMTPNISQL